MTDEGVYQDKVSGACKYKSFLKMSDYHAGGIKKNSFLVKNQVYLLLLASFSI